MLSKRIKGRNSRKELPLNQHEYFSDIICKKIHKFIKEKDVVMLYNAIDGEVDVSKISKISNKTFLYPRVEGDCIVPVVGKTFRKGAYGIQEPVGEVYCKKIDVVIVPMCAFDENCNRLGFGKGYYDRFLSTNSCLKIGVAFSCQKTDGIESKDTDVKMDYIITEKYMLECLE